HAARFAAAAAWTSADDDEGRCSPTGHDGAHLPRGRALRRDEPGAAGDHDHVPGDRHLAAERARLKRAIDRGQRPSYSGSTAAAPRRAARPRRTPQTPAGRAGRPGEAPRPPPWPESAGP